MRVYEFAKQHGLANKELIALLNKHGFGIESHMALLSEEARLFLEKNLKKPDEKKEVKKEAQNLAKEKIVVPIKPIKKEVTEEKVTTQNKPALKQEGPIILESMTVAEAAEKMNKPVSELILTLLKQGVA